MEKDDSVSQQKDENWQESIKISDIPSDLQNLVKQAQQAYRKRTGKLPPFPLCQFTKPCHARLFRKKAALCTLTYGPFRGPPYCPYIPYKEKKPYPRRDVKVTRG